MQFVSIRKIGITDIEADAIVNAANEGLLAGGGVCGAIFRAAGYSRLQTACDQIGHCPTGSAVITGGFASKAKYIIHAVGPRYVDGTHGEAKLLYSAYQKSLELAVRHNCRTVAFPLISAGIFGYPVADAWRKALQSCRDFLTAHPGVPLEIIFTVLSDDVLKLGKDTLEEIMPEWRAAGKDDWKTVELPASQ